MKADAPHILVVDDDTRLRDLLRRYLADNGFIVSVAKDTAEARRLLAGLTFDLMILDVMMPGEDGFSFTGSIRAGTTASAAVPILLLTARGEADDRIQGLEQGADDYLVKPFEPRELVLRIETILRRVARPAPVKADTAPVRLGECLFDPERGELTRNGEPVRLTSQEESLLRALARNAGGTLSREDLIRESRIETNERAIDVQVTRLRRKIERNPRAPRYLHTVRGEGYMLRPD
jgi:two-component system, OmpR family, phosphate regulon response regulator OmpR